MQKNLKPNAGGFSEASALSENPAKQKPRGFVFYRARKTAATLATTLAAAFAVVVAAAVISASGGAGGLCAAPRGGASTDSVRKLTSDEAAQMWSEFSRAAIAGDYCMNFSLSHRPRKGEETRLRGEIFGTKTPDGFDKTRIRIFGKPDAANSGAPRECIADYILVNDPNNPQVFKFADGKFSPLPRGEWNKPFADGIIYSPFDIMMPYKFWSSRYDGAGRIGQAVHYFLLTPAGSNSAAVRLALSREFSSPVQVQTLAADGGSVKTLNLASVKKIGSRWIMREIQLRDDKSRDKDILRFDAANFDDRLSPETFLLPTPPKPKMRGI